VTRAASDAGRRAVAVTLTREGHATVERVVRELLEHEEGLLTALGDDERARLALALETLLGSLRAT
jgi:DNA-binding MarR family transcriptional regulator